MLTDHHGERSNLYESFGFSFKGVSKRGGSVVNQFVEHPLTNGITTLTYIAGSGLIAYPSEATIIGWLSADTFIDLNDNNFKLKS